MTQTTILAHHHNLCYCIEGGLSHGKVRIAMPPSPRRVDSMEDLLVDLERGKHASRCASLRYSY